MTKLLSGRVSNFNIGISTVTENSRVLTATGNAFISGNLDVVGITTISGLKYPTSDGSENFVLKTDGSGNLSFVNIDDLQVVTFAWGSDGDLGLITDSVTETDDNGLITDSNVLSSYDLGNIVISGPIYATSLVLPSYTVSSLPLPNIVGQMLFVTDETGGSIPAFSDGTNWRRVTDREIVS
jgi:hypothetical protein